MHFVNMGYIIDKKSEIHPERIAITDTGRGRSYTYADLRARSDRCAEFLLDRGTQRGTTISVLSGNRAESFDIMFACAKLGCIFVPINFRLSAREVSQIVADAQSSLLFFDDDFEEKAGEIDSASVQLVDLQEINFDGPKGPQKRPWDYGSAEDPFVLIYTSGTSGEPKGAIQTHLNAFFKSVDSIIDWGMTFKDVVLVTAPLFHVAGLNALTLSGFHLGARVVLQNRFDAEETLQVIEQEGVTCFAVVPTALRMMANAPSFTKRELRSLRFVPVGGEPLEVSLQDLYLKKGAEVLNVFGLSETTDGAIYQRPGTDILNGSVGKPATHVKIRLMGPGSAEVEEGETGEVLVGGPTVSPGYWNNPQKTSETFMEGWVKTGDLAFRDREGHYYMVGRGDDMIKSGAEKVSPAEIERVIALVPGVADVVVIGVPDPKWGQVPKAVVARKKGARITQDDILEACKRELAGYKKPKTIVVVDDLPKTGSGKIDRSLIKRMYS